jgi:hypothetical protein
MSTHDEPERDAWLSEALRHAPDASASPPAALSDAILREARAATRSSAAQQTVSTRPQNKWLAAWSWLARPPVAAGFASVMVATLAGLMWWGQPIDQTLQRPPAETTARVETPAAPPAATAKVEAPVTPSAAAAAPELAQRRSDETADAARAGSARASERSEKRAPATDSLKREAEIATKSSAAAPSPFPAPVTPAPAPPPAAAMDAAPPVARSPAPFRLPPAPAPAQSPTSPSPGAAAATAAEPSAVVVPAPDDGPSKPTGATGSLAAKEATASATGRARQLARNSASTQTAAVDALLASIAEQPERWAWQRSAGTLPVTESLQRWLQELRGASGAQWRNSGQPPPAGKPLRLYRDGELAASLLVNEEGAWFTPAAGPASQAVLPPESAATLRRSLDIAAP